MVNASEHGREERMLSDAPEFAEPHPNSENQKGQPGAPETALSNPPG